VTRGLVLEWYGGTEVDEPIEVVDRASEVFLVSTTRDVQGVSHWDSRELPAPGPITREVSALWQRREPELLAL
jgi:branched-chain amino acid aminotransferase